MNMAMPHSRRHSLANLALMALGVCATIVALATFAHRELQRELPPEALRKAEAVGRSIDALATKAVRWGLPLERLPGLEELFASIQKQNPELAWIAIRSGERIVASQGDAARVAGGRRIELPLITTGDPAVLEIALDPQWVASLLREMLLDMAVIIVVAVVISMELAFFLARGEAARGLPVLEHSLHAAAAGDFRGVRTAGGHGATAGFMDVLARQVGALGSAWAGARARAGELWRRRRALDPASRRRLRESLRRLRGAARGRTFPDPRVPSVAGVNTANVLGRMRAPFFLFLFAEDLSRSFLPLFARSLPPGAFDVPTHLVASLPITLFMLIVALSQPSLGSWSERVGRRRAFLAGAALGSLAHLMSGQASSLAELLVLRSAAGLAWAVTFVAAQGYVIDHTDRRTRTRGLAGFVGIIMAASICGPAIGGLFADGLGPRWTFTIAGVFALVSALLAWRELPRALPAPMPKVPGMRDYAAALANPRFASLLLFAAIPAKVIVIAFCFYLLPLYIAQAGYNAAMAGRIIMLYSVMMVLLVPVSTELVERIERARRVRPHVAFVAGGLALSGLAGLSMLLPLGLAGAAALALLLGAAQALSIAPQSAMVPEVTAGHMQRVGESAIYGVYRLVERLGNAAGPMIAAYLLLVSGFEAAFAAIGAAVLVSGIVFYAAFRHTMAPAPVRP